MPNIAQEKTRTDSRVKLYRDLFVLTYINIHNRVICSLQRYDSSEMVKTIVALFCEWHGAGILRFNDTTDINVTPILLF